MAARWDITGTGHCGGLWPVLPVFLLAVLVPTGCVLWFMTAAVRNERLAVRQRLADIYAQRARAARDVLRQYWSGRAAALGAARGRSAPSLFAALVRAGAADGVVVYDEAGNVEYPAARPAAPLDAAALTPPWLAARKLEFEAGEIASAVRAYARIAQQGANVIRARALQAQARCLLRVGRKQEALDLLAGPLAEQALAAATDFDGRLIGPSALLLAVELSADRDLPQAERLAARLAARLNDYDAPAMASAQRRFLMRRLGRIAPAQASFATLPAEELAAEYVQARPAGPEPLRLSRSGSPGLWHMASQDGRIVAIFKEDGLLAEMASAARLGEAATGSAMSLVPPPAGAEKADAFLSVPAGEHLPGWALKVHLVGEDPFAAAADRQRTAYLWTGLLGLGVFAVLAVIVAYHISRQIRLTRLKNDLIATVSHELKTPLASMRLLVETLQEGRCRDPQQAGEYLQLMARENRRLTRLIDNFLAFSRMERNKRAFDFADVRVEEIVAEAADAVKDRFSRPGRRLDVHVAPGLPPLNCDRDAIVTVLLNLLDNAYKYSPGDKRVALRARAADGGVCLEVADNGIGMTRRAARSVFDRFYQADRRLARSAGGCGLGLSIVKFIVGAHGGTIDLESRPGKGSTFTVKLPAHAPNGSTPPNGR